jgi:hypothetical protein
MFKLGQKTSKRLLSGIFVSLLSFAVARISSVTVRRRSRFSSGKRLISDLIVFNSARDGGRIPLKLGMAKVERDGGFLRAMRPLFGPDGKVGPLPPIVADGETELSLVTVSFSATMAASKEGMRA